MATTEVGGGTASLPRLPACAGCALASAPDTLLPRAGGGQDPPTDGGQDPPTDGGQDPPTDGGQDPPTDGGQDPPTDGGDTGGDGV